MFILYNAIKNAYISSKVILFYNQQINTPQYQKFGQDDSISRREQPCLRTLSGAMSTCNSTSPDAVNATPNVLEIKIRKSFIMHPFACKIYSLQPLEWLKI
jgi:hypothetical protein